MALALFVVTDKTTNKPLHLVKANSKGQVNKHLAANVKIDKVSALDLGDIMTEHKLAIEDATAVSEDAGADGQAGGDASGDATTGTPQA